jgi:hypothetical protein
VKFSLRNPWCILGLVVLWRVALLVFTAQPIPANDAAFFDTAMVNWYLHGAYVNPGLSVVFPISGHEIYAAYPPLYQGALLVWMKLFGTTVISAMALHVALFAVAAFLVMRLVMKIFPATTNYALVPLLLFALTFDDRPEGLAHNFGLLSLLGVARMLGAGANGRLVLGIALALFCTLYTSVIVGALYFGTGFMAVTFTWLRQRKLFSFAPFVVATLLFAVVTLIIAKTQPLWWAGFQENARQTPVLAVGFRVPTVLELLKLIRTAPVFLLALALLPFLFAKRRVILANEGAWLPLLAGVFITGWGLLIADMTLLAANYVGYILFIQLLLAAGLLALSEHFAAPLRRGLRVALVGCVLLASVRAVGMTTWGAACAWKNSCAHTHQALLAEFAPFAQTNSAVIVSSAYVYTALEANVKNPVHSDWYFDRANWTNNADLNGFIALQPKKLVLVQFDYYRAFAPLLERLRAQPGLVDITVHDAAQVRTPDANPSLQRVLQHISWAPVIVDLEWKPTSKL